MPQASQDEFDIFSFFLPSFFFFFLLLRLYYTAILYTSFVSLSLCIFNPSPFFTTEKIPPILPPPGIIINVCCTKARRWLECGSGHGVKERICAADPKKRREKILMLLHKKSFFLRYCRTTGARDGLRSLPSPSSSLPIVEEIMRPF